MDCQPVTSQSTLEMAAETESHRSFAARSPMVTLTPSLGNDRTTTPACSQRRANSRSRRPGATTRSFLANQVPRSDGRQLAENSVTLTDQHVDASLQPGLARKGSERRPLGTRLTPKGNWVLRSS